MRKNDEREWGPPPNGWWTRVSGCVGFGANLEISGFLVELPLKPPTKVLQIPPLAGASSGNPAAFYRVARFEQLKGGCKTRRASKWWVENG